MDDVDDVVVGDHAQQAALVVHHGHGHEVVVAQQVRHLFLVLVEQHRDQALVAHLVLQLVAGPAEHDVAQRKHAHQPVLLVNDVRVVGNFLVLDLGADLRDGLVGGQALVEDDDLGVHDPARGIRVEGHEVADFLGVLGFEAAQQDVAVVLVQFVQHVGRVVGRHLGQDLGGHVGVEVFQQVDAHVLVKLGQGVSGVLGGQVAQHAHLAFQRKVLQMVGDVGGVGEFGVLARRGGVAAFLGQHDGPAGVPVVAGGAFHAFAVVLVPVFLPGHGIPSLHGAPCPPPSHARPAWRVRDIGLTKPGWAPTTRQAPFPPFFAPPQHRRGAGHPACTI